jgi:hypothetical protein
MRGKSENESAKECGVDWINLGQDETVAGWFVNSQ